MQLFVDTMKSHEGSVQTVLSSPPTTHGVRKILIRLKIPAKNTNINGESTSYAHDKETQTSSLSDAQKMNRKRSVLDLDCKTQSQEKIKKAKKHSTSNILSDEIKKRSHTFKKRNLLFEKRNNLLMSIVNSQGESACPICRMNCCSNKTLYQHMVLHADKDWKTFFKRGESQNHDAKAAALDLSKFLYGWDVKTGKRGRLASSVVDKDMQEAAETLLLIASGHQLKAKTSIMLQSHVQIVNGPMCLVDPFMVESGTQVEELMATSLTKQRNLQVKKSADTISGERKAVCGFDLNKLPAFEEV